MDFTKTTFIKTVVDLADRPKRVLPEMVLLGRSNVGKSSLINALTGQKRLAKTSATPGKTRYLNYYLVDETAYLVDAPGFGYTAYGQRDLNRFAALMNPYFTTVKPHLALYLIDSRRDFLESDRTFIGSLNRLMDVLLVFTKTDLLNQKTFAALKKQIQVLSLKPENYALVNQHDSRLLERLKEQIQQFF